MKRPIPSLVLWAALLSCAGGKDSVDLTKPLSGAAASDAAKAYEKGMAEKKDKNYLEAIRYFEAVRNNFPHSQYPALAHPAIPHMDFERDPFRAAARKHP